MIQTARNPKDVQSSVYQHRAGAYAAKGDFDRAIADMDSLIQREGSTEGYSMQGALLLAKGDYVRAIADFDMIQKLQPTS